MADKGRWLPGSLPVFGKKKGGKGEVFLHCLLVFLSFSL